MAHDRADDRPPQRPPDLGGAGEVAFRQVRYAAGIVDRARGVATVAAVEVLSRAGWDRSRDPGRQQDASDGKSENPFHRFRPPFRPSVASSRRTLRAARTRHGKPSYSETAGGGSASELS